MPKPDPKPSDLDIILERLDELEIQIGNLQSQLADMESYMMAEIPLIVEAIEDIRIGAGSIYFG